MKTAQFKKKMSRTEAFQFAREYVGKHNADYWFGNPTRHARISQLDYSGSDDKTIVTVEMAEEVTVYKFSSGNVADLTDKLYPTINFSELDFGERIPEDELSQ